MIDDEAIAIMPPRTDRVRYPDEAITNGQQRKGPGWNSKQHPFGQLDLTFT